MSFWEKSNLAMTAIYALAYGWYTAAVLPGAIADGPSMEILGPYLLGAVLLLVFGGIVAHILIAVTGQKDDDIRDERDRMIEMRADARSSYVLGTGAILALGLALMEQHVFWIVNAVLAGLVLAEIAKGVMRALAYRLGSA